METRRVFLLTFLTFTRVTKTLSVFQIPYRIRVLLIRRTPSPISTNVTYIDFYRFTNGYLSTSGTSSSSVPPDENEGHMILVSLPTTRPPGLHTRFNDCRRLSWFYW